MHELKIIKDGKYAWEMIRNMILELMRNMNEKWREIRIGKDEKYSPKVSQLLAVWKICGAVSWKWAFFTLKVKETQFVCGRYAKKLN